jgi:hypothetical protein
VNETTSLRYSVVVSETRPPLKSVPTSTGQELASVRDSTCSPRDQIAGPPNAILSQFELPRRSRGGRHPLSVGEWLSLVEHLVRDTVEIY